MVSFKQIVKTLVIVAALAGSVYGGMVAHQWFDVRFNAIFQAIEYSIQVKCL